MDWQISSLNLSQLNYDELFGGLKISQLMDLMRKIWCLAHWSDHRPWPADPGFPDSTAKLSVDRQAIRRNFNSWAWSDHWEVSVKGGEQKDAGRSWKYFNNILHKKSIMKLVI